MEILKSENKPKHEKFFVAFLDILGFKEMVCNIADEEKIFNILSNLPKSDDCRMAMHRAVDSNENDTESIQLKERNAALDDVRFYVMSDSIVVSVHSNNRFALVSLIEACLFIQCHLLNLNPPVLLRGAVAQGIFFRDDRIAFGKAMVDAYIAQENYARYPRIIIEDALINNNPAKNEIRNMLNKDEEDNYLYIDSMKDYFVDKKLDDPRRMEFKEFLKDKLSHYVDKSVREKYIWLEKDFNRVEEYSKPELSIQIRLEGMIDPDSENLPRSGDI